MKRNAYSLTIKDFENYVDDYISKLNEEIDSYNDSVDNKDLFTSWTSRKALFVWSDLDAFMDCDYSSDSFVYIVLVLSVYFIFAFNSLQKVSSVMNNSN